MTIQQLLRKARGFRGHFTVEGVNSLSEKQMIQLIVEGYDNIYGYITNPSPAVKEIFQNLKAFKEL